MYQYHRLKTVVLGCGVGLLDKFGVIRSDTAFVPQALSTPKQARNLWKTAPIVLAASLVTRKH